MSELFAAIGHAALALAEHFAQTEGVSGFPESNLRIGGVAARAEPWLPISQAIARWKDVLSGEDKSVRTISSYVDKVTIAADAAGWRTVGDVSYETALAFIAGRKRNDHGGKAWENGAIRHGISALKSFGKFLGSSGLCPVNPLGNLTLPKRRPQRHKHPFTESEARSLLGASLGRHHRDKRARGHAPLVWFTLFMTGLRHSEVQAPCKANAYGGLKWRDVQLDGEFPGIWTDPRWLGNKGKTRDWLPLHPKLAALLADHRGTVAHRPDDPVFPIWPIRATWVDDRARAKLPDRDDDGRALSVHATRASYITWLGRLALPEGLVSRLARHSMSLAERVYTTRDKKEMAEAVAQLPNIWPELGGGTTIFPPDSKNPAGGLASGNPIGYCDSGEGHEHHSNKRICTSDPGPSPEWGSGDGASAESRGRPVLDQVGDGRPIESANPDLRMRSDDRELLESTLRSLNLLVQRLACPGLHKEPLDGRQSPIRLPDPDQ